MPKNCYLFVYNRAFGSHEEVELFLDAWSDIVNWHSLFTGTFFIVSEKSPAELAKTIRDKRNLEGGSIARFLITTIRPDDVNGWMPRSSWDFILSPSAPTANGPVDNLEYVGRPEASGAGHQGAAIHK